MGVTTRRWFRLAVLVGLALGLASCAGGPEAPRWVRGKQPKDYSDTQYAWGVGSGAETEAAAAAATREVSRKTGGESEGAQIARTWVDEKQKLYWALAVLDRPAQLERLTSEITATDASLSETLASARQDAPPSQAFVVFLRAIGLASARDELALRIGRLGGTPPPGDPAHARAQLEEQLAALKHSLTVDVEAWEMDPETGATGKPLEQVRTVLAQELLARGFRIGTQDGWSAGSGWLLIRARVGIEPLELDSFDRFVAVEWSSAVEILDRTGDGEVLAILTHEARTTHLNEHEARRQALHQAEEIIAEAIADWLDERTQPQG